MALVQSSMMALGTAAPDFTLNDPYGGTISLAHFSQARALLVVFMCNHCPYVVHLKEALNSFAKDYQEQGIQVVGINSNDMIAYPGDNIDNMKADIETFGYVFPYLIDEDQSVARTYDAVCTPDFFLFDEHQKLFYRGEFDTTRPANGVPDGKSLRTACDLLLGGHAAPTEQSPSMGCSIKWKA